MALSAPQLPPPAPVPPRCLNCEAELAGPSCAQCGQKVHDFHISLWHLWDEFAEDYFHFESRLPRTLWYLISRPGFLTREFLAGRRARYVGPFKLYLMASVVFFLVVAITKPRIQTAGPHGHSTIQVDDSPPAKNANKLDLLIQKRMKERLAKESPDDIGRDIRKRLVNDMPDAMLALVPICALLLKLLYRKRFYAEHFVCALHLHAAAYLALLVSEVSPWGLLGFLAFVAFVVYAFVSLRRVYQQGFFRTAIKLGVLGFGYGSAVGLAITAVVMTGLIFN